METAIFDHARAEVSYGFLRGPCGDWMELHYSIVPTEQSQIAEQVRAIEDAEKELMRHLAVSEDSTAFKRLFSSDLISHREELDARSAAVQLVHSSGCRT